jgi:hypothetical protein
MAQTKITGDMIADDAVTTALIADDAVTADQLANSINSAITANTAKVTNAITTHTGDVTGGTSLTIAVDAVDIPMLSATGSPSNTTFLRGDNAWAAVPAGVDIQSSAPSVASEGSLYYNTTSNLLYASDGTAWQVVGNLPPAATGGTVTISSQLGFSTFSYNLGLNFSDADSPDANLTYTLASGTLPAGAVLPTSGNTALTGTATNTAATYNFVIRATDSEGASATQAYTQVIALSFVGTGGTITTAGGYKYHTFTSSGAFVSNTSGSVDIMTLAGGAGGGSGYFAGGGGGAGGLIETNSSTVSAASYTITIGAGGAGSNTTTNGAGGNGASGSNTVAFSATAIGGGAGAGGNGGGVAGGSGGGSGRDANSTAGGAGTSGQGNAGGTGVGTSYGDAGGGGGKAGVGGNGSAGSTSSVAGGGGIGLNWKSLGNFYAGGGGGASYRNNTNAQGVGGSGVGGSGGYGESSSNRAGHNATPANRGSGGGGGYPTGGYTGGGNGSSGIVIIRYAV